ncbi:MAG: MOSC domain-containing protein [Actinobacteria bacterium]|nr:MOSC domain-containing protein [Actinomycetota bacterium]
MVSVTGVWTSPGKNSGRMTSQERVRAVAGHGLDGCAHARPRSKRQVLFASAEHLEAVGVEPGQIRENFTVSGADVRSWSIGQRLRVGEATFEVTMVCDPCPRMDELRPGLQAELEGRRGMLARVLETGDVTHGDEVELLP